MAPRQDTSDSHVDSREHQRARAKVKVAYHFGTTTATGYSSDVSEGGMFLRCDKVADVGTRVYLRVHLPGHDATEPLKIIGTVTRAVSPEGRSDAGGEPAGMGLHFEVAYARTREHLSQFMSALLGDSGSARTEPNNIRLVLGSTDEHRTYRAHLGGQAERLDTLRPPEVERVFSFDDAADRDHAAGEPEQQPVQRALFYLLLLAIMAVIVYSMLVYTRVIG